MKRRTVLKLLTAGGLAGGLAGVGVNYWPDEGVWNPCLASAMPQRLLNHELVKAAWEGVDPALYIDCHTHLIGTGDSDSGIWLNPVMQDMLQLDQYIRLQFYFNASCINEDVGVDRQYVDQLLAMRKSFPAGAKFMLLAFDYRHEQDGQPNKKKSAFAIPDRYAAGVVKRYPDYFEWAASIHPYRADCVEALTWAVENGARAVKWLPPMMNIDPASGKCDRFYEALVKFNIPLLTHAGDEHAVGGVDAQKLGNPQLLRRPLDHGVRVIVAHCATLGHNRDLDKGEHGPELENYQLFARMMDEPRYEKLLYGDISAILQVNRLGPHVAEIIEHENWHSRLLNGSDYPLPGVMPLFSVEQVAAMGLLEKSKIKPLVELRRYNPVLFDFVIKRHLSSKGVAFSARVFETGRILRPV